MSREYNQKERKSEQVKEFADIEFELELIRQDEINVDYILMLVAKGDRTSKADLLDSIRSMIRASPELRKR